MNVMSRADASVLVIDDDVNCRALTRHAVERCGVKLVVEASNGYQAMQFFKRALDFPSYSLPSLILLDVEMQDMDGLETLRLIKQHTDLRKIPLVIVSEMGNGTLMEQALDMGVSGYYAKSRDPEKLIDTIQSITHNWLRKAERKPRRVAYLKSPKVFLKAG